MSDKKYAVPCLTFLILLFLGSVAGCIYWLTNIHNNFYAFDDINRYIEDYPYGQASINFTAKAFFRYRCENKTCDSLYLDLIDKADTCSPYRLSTGTISYPKITSTFLSCIDIRVATNQKNVSETITDFQTYYQLKNFDVLYLSENAAFGGAIIIMVLSFLCAIGMVIIMALGLI